MGISTGSVLIVGLTYDEIGVIREGQLEEAGEEFEDKYDDDFWDDIDTASPYFDSGRDDRIWGVAVLYSSDYQSTEITGDLPAMIATAHAAFKERFGVDGKLYLSPNVT